MARSILKLKTGSECRSIMSVLMIRYADKPCNCLHLVVLKDKQDFIWNEWV